LGKTVLVIVGMPGAGKSLASVVAKSMGLRVFVSGDIIRAEAKRRALKPSKENLGRLMLALRRGEGMGAVAKRLVPILDLMRDRFFVYEGARNVEEIDELRKRYRVIVVAIHASRQSRFERLLKRKRSDRPRNSKDFSERDQRELRVGVGKVIALADRMVENEDTREDLKRRMKRVLTSTLNPSEPASSQRQRSARRKTLTK
jgi:dephospho-CoA kinase